MKKSWKTTVTGVATILVGIGTGVKFIMAGQITEGVGVIIAAVTSGMGLIMARDNGVTSEDVGAK